MTDVNIVTLSVSAFAQIKNENCKYRLLVDNLLSRATLSEDHQRLEFNSEEVRTAIEFVFGEDYRKRLGVARTKATRYGTKGTDIESTEADAPDVTPALN